MRAVAAWMILPILLAASSTALEAQGAKGVDEARALVQAGEHARAVSLLEEITAREPDDPAAWSLLGFALHSMGEIPRAIEAHRRATTFETTRPGALYNLGLAFALDARPDSAFHYLALARDEGFDLIGLPDDPDAESLRADPRYRALFPGEAELSDPFVEDVRVLREWRGEAAGDQFGWIARAIGDVDGDGIQDVVTSAPTHRNGAGKVYVFSGATGAELWSRVGGEGHRFGLGVDGTGDVDGDGVPDVIAGAPGGDVTLVLGGGDGRVIHTLEARQPGEIFGRKADGVGDVDGDGRPDLVVGAPGNDAAGEEAGAAYVFSGRDGRLLRTLRGAGAGDRFGSTVGGGETGDGPVILVGAPGPLPPRDGGRTYVYRGLSGEPAFVIEADDTGAQLGGMFVSVVGDVDADGVADVYASDWANAALGRSTGRVYVHSGRDGRLLHVLTGEAAGDGFGIGTAEAGDVDGDGADDLVIGAWRHASVAPSAGKVYVHSGRDGSLLWSVTGKTAQETLGFDATGMGDVDGDGVPDLLVTSAWSAVRGPRSGRIWILSGRGPGG